MERGTPPEQIKIYAAGAAWGWSSVTKRWERMADLPAAPPFAM